MHEKSMSALISISHKRKKICVIQRRFCRKFPGTIGHMAGAHKTRLLVNDDDRMKLGGNAQDLLQHAFSVRFGWGSGKISPVDVATT